MSKKDLSRVSKGLNRRRFREDGEGAAASVSSSSVASSSVNSSEDFVSQAPENVIKVIKNPFEETSK